MKKVLILEDDRWFADSLRQMLGGDFAVKILTNPEEFFAIYETWQPDVLLADVILGAKNLFVLLNEIQSYTDSRNLPIVILSSISQQIDSCDVAQFGVKKVLDKTTMTPKMLRESLREIAENARAKSPKTFSKGAEK